MTLASTNPATTGALPSPTTERWQPLRLGLVDMFYYDDEQFWFHDGRLLLRGNNGTGKSKVLALTLPFLLDGSVLPRRVEPDADPKKRMDWNLLLGGAHGGAERTGYSWVEFGRMEADGTERFVTLGIGLKAATGRGIVKQWHFTTTRRIGDLRLMDASRTVLTDARLGEEIGTTGAVYSTQEAYRRAVDEALFNLGEDRYAALIDLLIQLRQPQLSKRPDEKALSSALTEALAPLDQAIIAEVAESFRSLEEERDGIAESKDTLRAAEEFLRHYAAYAKVAARRHTTDVRTVHSGYEHAGRSLREAEEQLTAAREKVAALEDEHASAVEREGMLLGEQEALRESPEMRSAEQLDAAETAAGDAERRAAAAQEEASKARERASRDRGEADEAVRRHDRANETSAEVAARAAGRAGAAGLTAEHESIVADAEAGRRVLSRRREQISFLRSFAEQVRAARELADRRRSALDEAEAAESRRTEEATAARAAIDTSVAGYRELVVGYLRGLTRLPVVADDLAGPAEEWARGLDGTSPVRTSVEAAAAEALTVLGRRRAEAEHRAAELAGSLEVVRARIAELESGRDPEPPVAPGRDPSVRAGAAGAPLWRVTDFADGLSATDRSGLEAALQSAGLLDAWIFPDGAMSAAGDVVLAPATDAADAQQRASSLAAVLVASVGPDADVPAEVVSGVLARIGLGAASGAALWVTVSGEWGAGPARGSYAKERAEYVGAGAREAYRRELLTRLRADAEALDAERTDAEADVATAAAEAAEVGRERDAYPTGGEHELVTAHERAAAAERELDRARESVEAAHLAWSSALEAAQEKQTELAEAAQDLGVGTTLADLDAAREAVSGYENALVELRAAAGSLADAVTAREDALARAAESAETLAEREETAREQAAEAAQKRSRADSLRSTVGASVAELQTQLGRVAQLLADVRSLLKRLSSEQLNAAGAEGNAQARVAELEQRRQEAGAGRERVIGQLRTFVSTGLLRVALPDLTAIDPDLAEEWTVTGAVALARTAEQHLESVDETDEAWSRVQQRVSNQATELATQMSRHGHTAFLDQRGDVMVARVRYLADELDIDLLAARLADDVTDRERLLTAREREILENHLVNEVASHLHELLETAEVQMANLNRELGQRRTSTGMQLRVRWRERPDGPAGLSAARSLMIRSDATWTAADRKAIGDFLQGQIEAVRQADPTAGWAEQLERALDYRQWHTFVVERHQNGAWRSASGPASGGEKVLAVSVPLFAAASAHYNSAGSPHAPRLILLDEAFAGVDDDSRAKSLGLLATFDLDVVMTSEREWACYPDVPGVAIAQLSRVEGIDAVGVTRWRWDGRRRTRVAEVEENARAGTLTGGGPTDDASLFE